jgi:DNA polymerase V
MNSTTSSGARPLPTRRLFAVEPCIPLPGCPLLAKPVPAGFPSPATDYFEKRLSLDEHLIEHQEATFFVIAAGNSMVGFGIHHGDLLIFDRDLEPLDKSIIIAVVDGGFTIKHVCYLPNGILLRSNGLHHGDILIGPEQELTVWGVVRTTIHSVWPLR